MSEQEKKYTEKEIAANRHIQHLQAVFGGNEDLRTESQKYVIEILENQLKAKVFNRSPNDGKFCQIAAAISEGLRDFARLLLAGINASPVAKVEKPKITK